MNWIKKNFETLLDKGNSIQSLVDNSFEETFGAYEFPFDRADTKIKLMPKETRREYYRQAKELIEMSKPFKMELQECIRTFYQELAIKTVTEEERHAYRLTLKFIQDFENRFIYLAGMYRQEDDPPVKLP